MNAIHSRDGRLAIEFESVDILLVALQSLRRFVIVAIAANCIKSRENYFCSLKQGCIYVISLIDDIYAC